MSEDHESEVPQELPMKDDALKDSSNAFRWITSKMIIEDDDLRRELNKDPSLRVGIPYTESRCFFSGGSSLDSRLAGDFDEALNELNHSLEMNPKDASTCVSLASTITHQMSLNSELSYDEKMITINKVVEQYKEALKLDPTLINSQLGLLEVYCLQRNYNAAIGVFGSCGDYINIREFQVVRSYLGCIALVLAGDTPDDEDCRYLNDKGIRLGANDWCVAEIDRLMVDLKREGKIMSQVDKAIKIHTEFLDHFDQEPYRTYDHHLIDAVLDKPTP